MPWDRNLGAPRVQVELAEEFRSRGHVVEKFCYTDAFAGWPRTQLHAVLRRSFAAHAKQHVMAAGSGFDVIDAQQGDVPYAKDELRFRGLLVARSAGLYALYRDFQCYERHRWHRKTRGRWAGRALRRWESWRDALLQRRSLEHADLINVPNEDERAFIRDELGLGDKCVVIPYGLADERFSKFESAASSAASRISSPVVAFIGYWSARKGSHDWGAIVRAVCAEVPKARFLFLGTGRAEASVLSDIAMQDRASVTVVPSFDTEELPSLLQNVTVGAFPSYIEGFPFAVLEKLAAGLPTAAYDVPGARETLPLIDPALVTPPGDPVALAARLTDLLHMPVDQYAALADRCRAQAGHYVWGTIADRTLALYAERLEAVRVR